jgi:hypothetical protein
MKKPNPSDQPKNNPGKDTGKDIDKGYPLYPEDDDIYNQAKEEKDIDLDDLSKIKPAKDKWEIDPDEDLEIDGDLLGDDLDVPGSELDDDDEAIGNEDEENNYYSIGGDRHEDLEESDE